MNLRPLALLAMISIGGLVGASAPVFAESREQCTEDWVKLVELGTIVDVSVGGDGVPRVMVKEAIWYLLDYPSKQKLVDLYNCWAFGDGENLGYTEIMSNMTNRKIGHWEPSSGLVVD